MNGGFDRSLENVQIKGNLTVVPDNGSVLDYDGSIEASGTLYVNTITGYNPLEDLVIQNAIFTNDAIFIPHSAQSTATTGALILNGGLSITATSEASGVSAGGSITTLGGVSIGKSLYVGGPSYFLRGADMANYPITSVTRPNFGTDAANKDYVDEVAGRVSGDFRPGEVIIGLTEGEGVFGSSQLAFDITTGTLSLGTGSSGSLFIESYDSKSILSFGGMDIAGSSILRSGLDMSSTGITNVADPVNQKDAANKSYVDIFAGDIRGTFGSTQLIIGFTDNSPGTGSVISSDQLIFNTSSGSLILGTTGAFLLENTSPNSIIISGGSTILGPANFNNDIFLTQSGGGMVTGLRLATDPTDAASKEYVHLFAGNIKGSLTPGQVVIASGTESIESFDTLLFDGMTLYINSTSTATGLGSGGSLMIYGGASIYDKLWLGNGLDLNINRITNVDTPIDPYDAVNKEYVDQLDIFGILSTEFDYKISLENGITRGSLEIQYPNDVNRAFYSYGYVYENTDDYGLFTFLGLYDVNRGWTITQYHMGENISMSFEIDTLDDVGTLLYNNPSLFGLANLRYKNAVLVKTTSDANQFEFDLLESPGIFNDSGIVYLNSELVGFTSYIYVMDETLAIAEAGKGLDALPSSAFWIITGLLKDNNWVINSKKIGGIDLLDFNIRSTGTSGILEYKSENSLKIKIQTFKVKREDSLYILEANTLTDTNILTNDIPAKPLIELGKDGYKTKFLTIYVEIPSTNQFFLYYISLFLDFDTWKLTSQFIGDNIPEIDFSVKRVSSGIGVLQYTNTLPYDAYILYSTDISVPVFTPLPVAKGGTGVTEILPDAVLRGNGTNPILATEDFIYRNMVLQLGTDSSILLLNSQNATSLTSGDGALTVGGGVTIGKDTYIGGTLFMNGTQIKQVEDPTDPQDAVTKAYVDKLDVFGILGADSIPLNEFEITRSLESNVTTPFSIGDISYNSDTVQAFYSYVFVYQDTDKYAVFLLLGMHSPITGWTLTQYHIGRDVNVEFSISSSGDLLYTNTSLSGVSYIKFKTGVQINTETGADQKEISLPTTFVPESTSFTYLNSSVLGITWYIYTIDSFGKVSFWIVTGLQKGDGTWVLHSRKINDPDNEINFSLNSNGTSVTLNYTSVNPITIKFKEKKIINDNNYYYLYKNVTSRTPIMTLPGTKPNGDPILPENLFVFGKDGVKTKFLTIYLEIPELNKYTIYFISALFDYDRWVISTQFIGDQIPEIEFFLEAETPTSGANIGILKYTNNFSFDAKMRYFYDIVTPVFNPLSVDKGGTGSRELLPFAILRGSGTSPVVATEDFVYRDFTLRLGNMSKILLLNTSDATGITNGTIITNGGMSIQKSLYIGGDLVVDNIDITPSAGDIWKERAYMAENGVFIPKKIDGLEFDNLNVRSFMGILSVHLNYTDSITSLDKNMYSQYTLNGLRRDSDWLLKTDLLGEDLLGLSISNNGEVYYTTGNISDWNYTKIKFRIMTTSV